jgi:hypothetical protein
MLKGTAPTKKAKPAVWQLKDLSVTQRRLRRFDNFPGFDAASAHLHAAVPAARKLDANGLQIGIETPTGLVVGV